MGSGKTTLGRRLALKLGYPFIDLDKEIEAEIQMPISEYFGLYGEDSFREKENQLLKTYKYPEKAIIATGGGAPCFFDNLEWMNQNGITAYLSLSPKALALRLANGIAERPILKNMKGDDLENFIAEKLKTREGFYKRALLIVKGADQSPERLSEILREENYLK